MTHLRRIQKQPSNINIVKSINYWHLMGKSVKILALVFILGIFSSSAWAVNAPVSNTPADDPDNLKVSVYPNPSKGDFFRINVLQHDAEVAEVKLYSALGDVILSEVFLLSNQNQTLTLSMADQLKSGVYMLSIKTSNAQVTRRIIVRN